MGIYTIKSPDFDLLLRTASRRILSICNSLDGVTSIFRDIRARAHACAEDIAGLAPPLIDSWKAHFDSWVSTHLALVTGDGKIENEVGASLEFSSLLKAELYFIRAFQDAMYHMIFQRLTATRPGKDRSMSVILEKTTTPVRSWIDHSLPNYPDWFRDFRDTRNNVKDGKLTVSNPTFRHSFEVTEALIVLCRVVSNADGSARVEIAKELSLAYILDALEMSANLAEKVLTE